MESRKGNTISRAAPLRTGSGPYAFFFGLGGVVVGLLIALCKPEPTPFQLAVFTAMISLAGAGIVSGIAGTLEVKTKWLKAGGPLAAFVFLFYFIIQVSAPGVLPGTSYISSSTASQSQRPAR